MKLPIPGPRDLFGVLERGVEQIEGLLDVVPRVLVILDHAEHLLALGPRLAAMVDRTEADLGRVASILVDVGRITAAAADEVSRVDAVVAQAASVAEKADVVVAQTQALLDRLTPLLDLLEPPLTKLQPTLQVLADTTDPTEVAALVAMVDHLPELTRRLEDDVLPMLGTLATVAPDLHDLLAVSTELNEIIGKVPGFGRIKRRVEDEREDDEKEFS